MTFFLMYYLLDLEQIFQSRPLSLKESSQFFQDNNKYQVDVLVSQLNY